MCNVQVFDEAIEMKDNAVLVKRPELFSEWDFEKNDELGLDIYKVSYGSKIKAWWKCPRCNSNYDMPIYSKANNFSCPYCNGRKVNYTNSLASLNPDLASQWDYSKNSKSPHDIPCGSKEKVWWIGSCGHEWEAIIKDRTIKNAGCPYCANQKVWIGYNDMWTTNPHLASQLLNKDDGHIYTQSAGFYTDWKCLECDSVIKNKKISNVYKFGVACSGCKDSISYPEKVVFNLFGMINVSISTQKEFSWSDNKRYDFYLEILGRRIIIETHGIQHYEESNRKGSRTLIEEQVNDRYKYIMAMHNGIDEYIVLDCRNSYIDWIKNSVMKSELVVMFNLSGIDWKLLDYKSRKSTQIESLDLWNSGLSVIEITKQTCRSASSVSKTLSNFAEQGRCIYPRSK